MTNNSPYTEVDRGYETPCWIWQGTLTETGYGRKWLWPGTDPKGRKQTRAHRYYYEQACGDVPEGKVLHHLCGVRACCRPGHLEVVDRGQHIAEHKTRLSERDKAEIIRLYASSDLSGQEIAQEFGIVQAYVSELAIKAGVRRDRTSKLSEDQVREIKVLLRQGVSAYKLSQKYDVSYSSLKRIKSGETWRGV